MPKTRASSKNNGSSVLVTGAAGFIAFHLIEYLLENNFDVVGIDNLDPYYSPEIKKINVEDLRLKAKETGKKFTFLEADIIQRSALEHNLKDQEFSSVIHLAAKVGVRPSLKDPFGYLSVNVMGTLNLLEICKERKISEFILGSTSSIYGRDSEIPFSETSPANAPISPYAVTKKAAELMCSNYAHLYDMKIALLRFFTVFGPRQRPDLAIHLFAKKILAGETIPFFGEGNSTRDYTYVTDIISGIAGAMGWVSNAKAGQCDIFNLGGGCRNSLNETLGILEATLNKKAKINRLDFPSTDMTDTHANVEKSKRVLGFVPQVDLQTGIDLFCEWLLHQSGSLPQLSKAA